MKVYGKTDIGRRREDNQDRFLVDTKRCLFVVADGMGGHDGGSEAAEAVVKDLKAISTVSVDSVSAQLHKTNKSLVQISARKGSHYSMGSTASAVLVHQKKFVVINAGDSPVMLWRNGNITCVHEEHTVAAEVEKATGKYLSHLSNSLTQTIGINPSLALYTESHELKDGDMILICSDGLTNEVSKDDIASTLSKKMSPKKTVENLIDMALVNGGRDNITAILIQV